MLTKMSHVRVLNLEACLNVIFLPTYPSFDHEIVNNYRYLNAVVLFLYTLSRAIVSVSGLV